MDTRTTVNSNEESRESMNANNVTTKVTDYVVKLNVSQRESLNKNDPSGYFSASSDDDGISSSEDGENSEYRRRSTADDDSASGLESVAGRKDTRIAARLRLVVAALFLSMGIIFPIIIYKTTRSNEEEAFEDRFDGLATKVVSSMENRLSRSFGSLESLRIAISSHVRTSDDKWPFVTLPDYDLRAESVNSLGGVLSVSVHPIVEFSQKKAWEDYSVSNIGWLEQSTNRTFSSVALDQDTRLLGSPGRFGAFFGFKSSEERQQIEDAGEQSLPCQPPNMTLGFPQEIYNLQPDAKYGVCVDNGLHSTFPTWQVHPPVASSINLNTLSIPAAREAILNLTSSGDAVLSGVYHPNSGTNSSGLEMTYQTMVDELLGSDERVSDALAFIYYPIFQTFEVQPGDVVGVFSSVVALGDFFREVLPLNIQQSDSVICVLENDCGDRVSYKVIGEKSIYLGASDGHNPEFDDLAYKHDLEWPEGSTSRTSGNFDQDQGVELSTEFCPYRLSVYPSDEMRSSYVTNQPVIFAVCFAVAVFLVTATSLLYDYFVQRRMRRAVKAAKENRAIVSSLFPENVRTRMFQDEGDRKQSEDSNKWLGVNEYFSRRGSNETSRRTSNEGSRRNSNEGRRRFSNEVRRRTSNEREVLGAISEPIINAVETVGHAVGTVGHAVGNVGYAVVGLTSMALAPAKMRLRSILKDEKASPPESANDSTTLKIESKPIADLFPHCTVLFADISGFTAWSSEREPEQVFTLLQAIFHKFDTLAEKKDIFKVETIGDCYMAVAGLPDPQPDHAERMVKFARTCIQKFATVVKNLETQLGPGTSDLRMRFGLNSGPVTAGVLRTSKSRFQLFGDTVNTASRMESTGQRNRIQISETTAQSLIESGRENWIRKREDLVHAKGKGEIQTYWVLTSKKSRQRGLEERPKFIQPSYMDSGSDLGSVGSGNLSDWAIEDLDDSARDQLDAPSVMLGATAERLIDWQVDLLLRLIKQIIAGRDREVIAPMGMGAMSGMDDTLPVDSISESIELPEFDPKAARARAQAESSVVEVPDIVISELREFVTMIATRYRDNPFHCFAHAAHVSMSCQKILNRITSPEDVNYRRNSIHAVASDIHECTYGITSDPLTQLAIMVATLAHDVDHTGVPNPQRNKEEPELADKYHGRSIAEQNSIDLTWSSLMNPKFQNLQEAIFSSVDEIRRFRQLLVNLIMATDIFEPQQKAARNARWEKAFHTNHALGVENSEHRTLKASIVIEHIIQAADVSHTMQHWHVYVRWNERLFQEMYRAYENGRSQKDPSEGWYKGEIWFFDNYVIPLAKKLDECGVFGVTSDECLNYALQNRQEWEAKGERIVKDMIERVKTPRKSQSRAVRRRSLGYMARRSATFMVPTTNNVDFGSDEESMEFKIKDEELMMFKINDLGGHGGLPETPLRKDQAVSLASTEFDSDDEDSAIIEA